MFKLIILERDPVVSMRLESILRNQFPNAINHIQKLNNRDDAYEYISKFPIDLLISDLNIDGQSLLKILDSDYAASFQTIIISDFVERAYELFNYHIIDFIRKPFSREDLIQAFKKFESYRWPDYFRRQKIAIKDDSVIRLVDFDEIAYLSAEGHYIKVHYKMGSYELVRDTLSNLQRKTPNQFRRVHKSYIVNIEQVRSVDINNECILKNDVKIPISKKYSSSFTDLVQ
ncbi:MAG: response regulator transcription factor [Calditrichaeota bacterium]|nr:response regulator transcription factor [Calditrichota bacterium]